MYSIAIVWDHRRRTKKGHEGPVEVRIIVDRKAFFINTGVKVCESEFVGGTIVDRPDSDVLNERVQIVRAKVMKAVNECLEAGLVIASHTIKKYVWNKVEAASNNAMIDWIEEQTSLLQHQEGTMKHYRTLIIRLKDYDNMTTWNDVTVENLYGFDAWLHGLKGWNGQKISDGAVYNYHKCFKALLNRAVKFGIIQANPYDRIRGEFKRGDVETVEYLTEEQMHAIENLPVQPGSLMDKCKDVFIFQMYTGLAYSDAQAFDIRKYRNEDGMWTYIGERIKTGVAYISRLLPPAVAILEKYEMKIPRIENHVYNRTLKAIGIAAGISFPLHSHIARHTFATYMLANKVSLDSVSVMLGHTNTVQTRRYAKTLAQTVRDDFDKVAEKLKEKTPSSQMESQINSITK